MQLGRGCKGDSICLDVVFAQAERDRQTCRCASERLGNQFGAVDLQKIAKIERAQSLVSAGQTYADGFASEVNEATKLILESKEIANAGSTAEKLCLASLRDAPGE